MIVSPGFGTTLNLPKRVHLMFGLMIGSQLAPGSAKLGRSLYWRSRFVSRPVVMLKGGPVLATMKGLNTNFHHGALMVPISVKRCRTSPDPRPNSPVKSYELTGNPPPPSVSLLVLLNMY